jgi:hypothetical protein
MNQVFYTPQPNQNSGKIATQQVRLASIGVLSAQA